MGQKLTIVRTRRGVVRRKKKNGQSRGTRVRKHRRR